MAFARSPLQLELLCRCYGIVHVLLYICFLELCLTVNLFWRKIDVFEFKFEFEFNEFFSFAIRSFTRILTIRPSVTGIRRGMEKLTIFFTDKSPES